VANIATPGHVCHMPRETASTLTCGFFPVSDYDHSPTCVVVWGSNLFQTNEEGVTGSQLKRALDQGAKLIVIDPRKTGMANRADIWIRPRPGTDLALALGMLRVMVDQNLYDRNFVKDWTAGFPELVSHLAELFIARSLPGHLGFRRRHRPSNAAIRSRLNPPPFNGATPSNITSIAFSARGHC